MEDTKMKKHVTVVGAIHIGFGILNLILALGAFFALHFARQVVPGSRCHTHSRLRRRQQSLLVRRKLFGI